MADEVGSKFDREKARAEMLKVFPSAAHQYIDRLLDALAGCVSDEPQTMDRTALTALVHRYTTGHTATSEFEAAILALLQPTCGSCGACYRRPEW